MLRVIDLLSGEENHFDDATVPAYGVAYCYCMANNLASWFFAHVHGNTLDQAYAELPMLYSNYSVACGNYAARLSNTEKK